MMRLHAVKSAAAAAAAAMAVLAACCAVVCICGPASAQAEPTAIPTPDEPFAAWRDGFSARAVAAGHDATLVRETLADVTPDLALIRLDRNQPEFVRPIWEYLDSAVSQTRQTTGAERLAEEAALLAELAAETGVPADILVAVWGLESAFGAVIGDHDVVRALSTLAWDGRRRALFERELLAVFTILAQGDATRAQLIGGWAGAMGQTQFMPSTYVAYAVDHDGDGRKNLWTDRGDALASAASYLERHGWRAGEPWGVEVALPAQFNFALADGRRNSLADWVRMGVRPANGGAFPEEMRTLRARALAPAGARGPVFLTFANYDVIKRYNNSTAYALAVGLLADRLGDRPPVRAAWPRDEQPLSRSGVKEMQRRLTALGYDTQGVDGRVGPNTRRALRAWQAANGAAPDAFATRGVLEALRGGAR